MNWKEQLEMVKRAYHEYQTTDGEEMLLLARLKFKLDSIKTEADFLAFDAVCQKATIESRRLMLRLLVA